MIEKIKIENKEYEFDINQQSHVFLKDENKEEIIGIKYKEYQDSIQIITVQYTDTPAGHQQRSKYRNPKLAKEFLKKFIELKLLNKTYIEITNINSEAGKRFAAKIKNDLQEKYRIEGNIENDRKIKIQKR